jgi:hypothetical protein
LDEGWVDIRAVWAVAEACWQQNQSCSSSGNSGKKSPRMSSTYHSQEIVPLRTQVQRSFLHLQHTRHQLSVDRAGLHGLHVDFMNSCSNYFAYLCIPGSKTTLHQKYICQLRKKLTFYDRLWKTDARMNAASWIARMQGVRGLQLFYRV